jgi:hypothetical protein
MSLPASSASDEGSFLGDRPSGVSGSRSVGLMDRSPKSENALYAANFPGPWRARLDATPASDPGSAERTTYSFYGPELVELRLDPGEVAHLPKIGQVKTEGKVW